MNIGLKDMDGYNNKIDYRKRSEIMEREKFMNSDLMKFYEYGMFGKKDNLDFLNPVYYEFVRINEKEIPQEDYSNEDYELECYDDLLQCGVKYKDIGTIWYNDPFIEEVDDNVFEYSDLKPEPVALTLIKPGTIIFSPEITIGNKIDFETVCGVLDGVAGGTMGSGELSDGSVIIECKMDYFFLELIVEKDILKKATIYAIGNPAARD